LGAALKRILAFVLACATVAILASCSSDSETSSSETSDSTTVKAVDSITEVKEAANEFMMTEAGFLGTEASVGAPTCSVSVEPFYDCASEVSYPYGAPLLVIWTMARYDPSDDRGIAVGVNGDGPSPSIDCTEPGVYENCDAILRDDPDAGVVVYQP
jgi:hypothetical protein